MFPYGSGTIVMDLLLKSSSSSSSTGTTELRKLTTPNINIKKAKK